jgi:hypothetical protein
MAKGFTYDFAFFAYFSVFYFAYFAWKMEEIPILHIAQEGWELGA